MYGRVEVEHMKRQRARRDPKLSKVRSLIFSSYHFGGVCKSEKSTVFAVDAD